MDKILRYTLQLVYYSLFMAVVWYFSFKPAYHHLESDQAVITLSFAHVTERREACRELSQEELMKLPPNMRLARDCPRERSPLKLAVYLDNQAIAAENIDPPGFHNDQAVNLFRQIKVESGEHMLKISMNDDVKVKDATYLFEKEVVLQPEQRLLVEFDAGSGDFIVK